MEGIIDKEAVGGREVSGKTHCNPSSGQGKTALHLSGEQIRAYWDGSLGGEQVMELLEHAAVCDDCALRLAEGIGGNDLITPRRNRKQELLEQARRTQSNVIPAAGRFSPRMLMLTYSLKIGTAVAAALVFLFAFNPQTVFSSGRLPGDTLTVRMSQITQNISSSVLYGSNRLLEEGADNFFGLHFENMIENGGEKND